MVDQINESFSLLYNLSNDEFRYHLSVLKHVIENSTDRQNALNVNLVEVFAIVKETARRFSMGDIIVTANDNDRMLAIKYDFVIIDGERAIYKNKWDVCGEPLSWDMVHYDEQLLGGIMLHYGYATEMATGEGKTLVATLPVFLNALAHDGVHLMTVNEYLSKRDFETTRPIYMFHGLSADCIEYYPHHDYRRKLAYKSDITFGTNSSFTFDYLRDHIAITPDECVQAQHNYAIIDELDSILIDDADDPHIVGGGNIYNNEIIYKQNFSVVKGLISQTSHNLYFLDALRKEAYFTEEGKSWLADKLNFPDLYSVGHTYEIDDFEQLTQDEKEKFYSKLTLQNVLQQTLLALTVFERDVDYIVEAGKVKIVDAHTGRVKETSRWEHGLHTAIEVKENVKVQDDFDGMAVISLKNYFKLYNKVAGMSGTIMPVEEELLETYNLRCATLPTHKPMIRMDVPLRIFKTTDSKDRAIIDTIIENRNQGRPTLVGSISIKRSEKICDLLDEAGVIYNKLDAKTIKGEAQLVAQAGVHNTITVSTSVAGRGTDIKPSPDAIDNGGLMVVGTDLFESIRVDRQLKGRSGRQGNPGASVFFASLDDYILKNLTEDEMSSLKKIADEMPDNEISCDVVRTYFDKAQSIREAYFAKCRKETARKDDIIAPHRKKFYDKRNAVLFNVDKAVEIVDDIIAKSNLNVESVNSQLDGLYQKTKALMTRVIRNNINRSDIFVPFVDNFHTFAIKLEVIPTLGSPTYFFKEFKRQILLQVYDKVWTKFVLHILQNLDEKEVDMLEERYQRMAVEINSIIISRLQYASIPFDARNNNEDDEDNQREKVKPKYRPRPSLTVMPDALCPCGSGRKFCECHGGSIRRERRTKRR